MTLDDLSPPTPIAALIEEAWRVRQFILDNMPDDETPAPSVDALVIALALGAGRTVKIV